MDSENLKASAEAGDVESQYKLGLNYIYGTDVPKDTTKAAEWFKKAADQGYLPARRELALLLAAGDGVDVDMEKAIQYHLGLMYEVGIGIPKDLQKSVRMLAYAAEMGYPGADTDAERVDKILYDERVKKLRARPLLHLQISDVDVEAACCKPMLDHLISEDIVFIDSRTGPALLGEDKDGMDAVLDHCPFCGAPIQIIPRDTKF